MSNKNKVEIKFMCGKQQFGRAILFGQLYNIDQKQKLLVGSLAQILLYVRANSLDLVNAQEILNYVVIDNGFAS